MRYLKTFEYGQSSDIHEDIAVSILSELKKLQAQYDKVNKLMPQYRKKHEEINKELERANKVTSKLEKTNKKLLQH